jgi:hypothetical protein
MNVTTHNDHNALDMVRFAIATGARYDGPQVVMAALESAKATSTEIGAPMRLIFQIVDDSRCMAEHVEVLAMWPLIRDCQNDTVREHGVRRMADRIMREYLESKYVYPR